MYKKILVPIDGSKLASDALLHALDLAKTQESEVEILHVMSVTEDLPREQKTLGKKDSPPEWVKDYVTRIRENDERMLDDALKRSKALVPGATITSKLLLGRAWEVIIQEAEKGGFDLIVIGSRGLGGIKELVLGSVSHEVVEKSKVPVLVVK
jgi:nucleotide-binding universal stress UspA family protein